MSWIVPKSLTCHLTQSKTCQRSSETGKKLHRKCIWNNKNITLIQFFKKLIFQKFLFGKLVEIFPSEVAPSGVVPRSLPPPTSDPHELKVGISDCERWTNMYYMYIFYIHVLHIYIYIYQDVKECICTHFQSRYQVLRNIYIYIHMCIYVYI